MPRVKSRPKLKVHMFNLRSYSMEYRIHTGSLLLAMLIILGSCEDPSHDSNSGSDPDNNSLTNTYRINVEVKNASTGIGVSGYRVRLYAIDTGFNREFWTIKTSSWGSTNDQGKVAWDISFVDTPRICGYDVTDNSGSNVKTVEADMDNNLIPFGSTLYIDI